MGGLVWFVLDRAIWFGLVWSGIVWLVWPGLDTEMGGWLVLCFVLSDYPILLLRFLSVGRRQRRRKQPRGLFPGGWLVVSCRCGPGWERKGLLYLPALRTSTERSREDRILYLHCGPRHRGRERIADHIAVAIATPVL